MYTFHLANKKVIKLEHDHILCQWSRFIQDNKENDINLKQVSSDEFKMLIRIMELIMNSQTEVDFVRKIQILSQLSNIDLLKKSLFLMAALEIVPPTNFKVLAKITEGSLANVIAPIFAKTHYNQKVLFGDKSLTKNDMTSLMLYNQITNKN